MQKYSPDPFNWGRQEFAQRALALAAPLLGKGKSRAYGRSPERLAHSMAEAEKLMEEGLSCAGLKAEDLELLPANDPRKVALARLISKTTTVSQPWIAERLKMRNAANVSLAIHRGKDDDQGLPLELRNFLFRMQEYAH